MLIKLTILTVAISFATNAMAFDHSHGAWSAFLKKNAVVSQSGSVSKIKYKSLKMAEVKVYTETLLKVPQSEVNSWNKNQQLAFYFNLYNSLTIQLIKKNYPISSIKKIVPFWKRATKFSTWKIKFFKLFGKEGYLDKIEHELVRGSGKYKEPRVHFAFNCASIGCPALLGEAFQASKLEGQLQKSMVSFLKDRSRNRMKNGKLEVSKIFYWYKEDFSKGWGGYSSLADFFSKNAESLTSNPQEIALIKSKKAPIIHLDYNWNLNDAK